MVEISIRLAGIGIHPFLHDTVAIAIAESRVGRRVNTHGAECTDDLRHYFTVVRTRGVERIVILHTTDAFCSFLAENDLQTFLQLRLYCRIIPVRIQGLHDHAYHIKAESITAISMVEQRIEHALTGIFGILRNGVITHIHGDQPECRTVDGIIFRIIVKLCHQITDVLTGRMDDLLAVIIFIQLRTVHT